MMTCHSDLESEIRQLKRSLELAKRQWESWKQYSFELQKKLLKYEPGSPMILNTAKKGTD